jgi:hypothetical protein
MASTVGVRLARNWFGPDGSLYEVRGNPHEFPAEYAEKPKKAEDESDADYKARLKTQPYAVLPSTAEIIGKDARTVVTLQDTANGEQVLIPTLLDEGVKSVGGALDDKGIEQPSQTVASAAKGAGAQNLQVGGVPGKSGPLSQAASDKKK